MTTTIYLLHINKINYALRNFWYSPTIAGYLDAADISQTRTINNWHETNGVNHKETIWFTDGNEVFHPNYLIKVNSDNTFDRYFVIEDIRQNESSYELTLVRDVVADNWVALKADSMLMKIEKGSIKDINNKLIYNQENFNLNEIKQPDTQLKQFSCQWVYIYYTNFHGGSPTPKEIDYLVLKQTSIDTQTTVRYEGWSTSDEHPTLPSEPIKGIWDYSLLSSDANFGVFVVPLPVPGSGKSIIFNGFEPDYQGEGQYEFTYKDCYITGSQREDILTNIVNMCSKIGGVLDIQILPYIADIPYVEITEDATAIYIRPTSGNFMRCNYIATTNDPPNKTIYPILPIVNTSYTLSLDKQIQIETLDNNAIMNLKLNNICEKYRLVSPNYNGIYEIDPTKNNGSFSGFDIYVNLKPINPFIEVKPKYTSGTMYGDNYKDERGLILQGDFSYTQATEAWTQFELNNRNYQAEFNRDIEHMDTMEDYAFTESVVSSVTGTISGGLTGAAAGAQNGGAGGAIAGGIIGTLTSAVGGITDSVLQVKRYSEDRSYTIDKYNYNLANIKARPKNISKVSAFTENNRLYPILERYECSDKEIDLVKNKLLKFGYTINTIDSWNKYDGNYIRGRLIQVNNITDVDVINQIDTEFSMGFREVA